MDIVLSGKDAGDRRAAEAIGVGGRRAAERGIEIRAEERLIGVLRWQVVETVAAALDDRVAEEAGIGPDSLEIGRYAEATRRFAGDRHGEGIAAEGGNVAPYPFHRELLVHQAVIAGIAPVFEETRLGRRQSGLDQPAEGTKAVVDGHGDDVVLGDHDRGVIHGPRATGQRAAMDPEEDRQTGARMRRGRHIDIEEETIF
jgi:hypothetical protein